MNLTFVRAGLSAAALVLACQTAFADDAGRRAVETMRVADSGMNAQDHGTTQEAVTAGDLRISKAFARATPPNAPVGGGYLTITNNGSEGDRLVAVQSPAAPDVQMHEMKMADDVMQMNRLENGIPLPAGETVTLAPGGLHLMFMRIHEPFAEGGEIPVTLTFEKAGEVELMLTVLGGEAGVYDHAGHGDQDSMEMDSEGDQ